MACRISVLFSLVSVAIFIASTGPPARAAWFVRGDASDSGALSVSDAVEVFRVLFGGALPGAHCLDALDADDDGQLEVTDGVHLLRYLFLRGPAPAALLPGCWSDPTADPQDCQRSEACGSLGVFFCIDKSDYTREGNRWSRLQEELTASIAQLTDEDQFALVLFDQRSLRFPETGQPANATGAMKAAAIALVQAVEPGSGTCTKAALVATLNYAVQSTARKPMIIYRSGGFSYDCPGTDHRTYANEMLAEITQRIGRRLPLHSICRCDAGSEKEAFMRRLAELNEGSYVRVKE